MLYTDWWVTSLCEVVMVTHQTHQTFQTSRRPDVPRRAQTCPDVPRRAQTVCAHGTSPDVPRRAQTCPDVPQTPRRPDAQTPARRLPDACQTRPDAARRSRRQGSSPAPLRMSAVPMERRRNDCRSAREITLLISFNVRNLPSEFQSMISTPCRNQHMCDFTVTFTISRTPPS